MEKWKEMIQESFIKWTNLPKEILETEENHTKILEALDTFRASIDNLNKFKNALVDVANQYNTAKASLAIESLRKLNSEAELRNKIIDDNFDTTLNWLASKKEGETEDQIKTRLVNSFKLPIK